MGNPFFADQAVQWFLSTGIKYILGALVGCMLAILIWWGVCTVYDVLARWWHGK